MRLVKLTSLKVTIGASTQLYKDQPANVAAIARQLGAIYVLEGSVQKTGGTVGVNVQFVRANAGTHVWRKLTTARRTIY